tara:strand:+ start:605 stop:844 length:240 start_codon:yes stop_codon:yes gene_type:complete
MKIKVKGEHTISSIRQALYEQLHELESKYGVRFTLDATLYIRPTNGFGADVEPRFANGEPVRALFSNGPYKPAIEEYEA